MSTKLIRYMFISELSLMRSFWGAKTHLLLIWIILPLEAFIIVKSLFYVCNVICRCLCLFSFYSPSYFPLKTLRKYNKCKRLLHIYGLYYCSTNRLCRKIIIAERTILEKLWYSFLSPFCETFSLLSIYVLPLLNCFSALLKLFSIIFVVKHII